MKTAVYGNQKVLDGMREHWLKVQPSSNTRDRTIEQQAWDNAIMACVEYLRRIAGTDGGEFLALLDLLANDPVPYTKPLKRKPANPPAPAGGDKEGE